MVSGGLEMSRETAFETSFRDMEKEEITLYIQPPAPFPATSLKWRDTSQIDQPTRR
jgi:hypothetical protein